MPISLTTSHIKAAAEELAKKKYDHAGSARAFMENPQPTALNTKNTEYEYYSPNELIDAGYEKGIQRIFEYLGNANWLEEEKQLDRATHAGLDGAIIPADTAEPSSA